jgi:hypothetical protein
MGAYRMRPYNDEYIRISWAHTGCAPTMMNTFGYHGRIQDAPLQRKERNFVGIAQAAPALC